jgi:RND family efflux transporter MFP subunit
MKHMLSWIVTAVLFTAVGGLGTWAVLRESHHEHETEEKPGEAKHEPAGPQLGRDDAGNVTLTLDAETQQRAGIQIAKLEAAKEQPEVIAYGTLREDPAFSFTLRAPIDGVLRGSGQWPKLGDTLKENAVIGRLDPRLSPIERADLTTKLNDAQAQVQETRASLEATKFAYENKRQLNTNNKLVSDQELHDAEAKVKGEEARLDAATTNVKFWESFLAPTSRPADNFPLNVGMSGQVIELMAREGEAVQNGQAILRIARFDRLAARVSLPVGHLLKEPPKQARLIVVGHEDTPIDAETISPVIDADAATGGQTFILTSSNNVLSLQPGMAVTAHLPMPGDPLQGVIVPRSAVIRFGGKAWVYVPADEKKFVRHEINLEMPSAQGFFLRDLKAGESVVTSGAQSLLSLEAKLQTVGGKEEEE